jgi:hypothetical protein
MKSHFLRLKNDKATQTAFKSRRYLESEKKWYAYPPTLKVNLKLPTFEISFFRVQLILWKSHFFQIKCILNKKLQFNCV